jgi:hypothetical protein
MPDPIAPRVAARFAAQSDFFKVGDPILYGKYKNKKGIIVRVFDDEKGHPSIEIEPVPKGRKKNRVMGLYKIWHDEKGHPSIEIEPVPKGRKKNRIMGLYKIWHDEADDDE